MCIELVEELGGVGWKGRREVVYRGGG